MPNPKVPFPPFPFQATGWWYQEFPVTSAPQPQPVTDAQNWLNDNIKPNEPIVFGNIDGKGGVRFFWYGTKTLRPVLEP